MKGFEQALAVKQVSQNIKSSRSSLLLFHKIHSGAVSIEKAKELNLGF